MSVPRTGMQARPSSVIGYFGVSNGQLSSSSVSSSSSSHKVNGRPPLCRYIRYSISSELPDDSLINQGRVNTISAEREDSTVRRDFGLRDLGRSETGGVSLALKGVGRIGLLGSWSGMSILQCYIFSAKYSDSPKDLMRRSCCSSHRT